MGKTKPRLMNLTLTEKHPHGRGEDQAIALTEKQDMFDQVRARLLKAYGMTLAKSGRQTEAVEPLKRALELDERSGVKKLIEQTEREIKKNSVTPDGPATEPEQPES